MAVDVDLVKCFDRINHDCLMTQLGYRIKDNGTLLASRDGVPQGGPLSPLLSNVVLDLFDKELERRGHHFARYADDCVPRAQSVA